jgi:hypothetical protein
VTVYDHPLIRLGSRQAVAAHFILLHLLSPLYLPSPAPSSMVQHSKTVFTYLKKRLRDDASYNRKDPPSRTSKQESIMTISEKGKAKELESALPVYVEREKWLGTGDHRLEGTESISATDGPGGRNQDDDWSNKHWWRLWDVRADCREIGTMECYGEIWLLAINLSGRLNQMPDGYHIAMIEQYV